MKAPKFRMPATLWLADTDGIQLLASIHSEEPNKAMRKAIHWHRYVLQPERETPKQPKRKKK
jgi:hypothetical protein